jgi:hypothetical protein
MKDLERERKKKGDLAAGSGNGRPAGSEEKPAGGPLAPEVEALLRDLAPKVRERALADLDHAELRVGSTRIKSTNKEHP